MTTAHTATPWRLLDKEPEARYLRIRGTKLGGKFKIANVPLPAWTEPSNFDVDESVANAEFIVRACNAHDDLVKALQESLAVIERIKPANYGSGTLFRGRDALAKAGAA